MKNRRTAFIALLLVPLVALRAAELKLPSIFSDHAVLQSEKPLPAWGWADAGERVTVKFAGQSKTAAAGADGKWLVKLDALEASADLRGIRYARSIGQGTPIHLDMRGSRGSNLTTSM
jgi:hypothetical protein